VAEFQTFVPPPKNFAPSSINARAFVQTNLESLFSDCHNPGASRTLKATHTHSANWSLPDFDRLSQCQTIRATPGIRRKAAVTLQLSASVPRSTTNPFAMAGSPVFSRAYCSQLTKA
jgi:hypothetical protein